MGATGTWPDPMPGMMEVLPTPSLDTELQPGDVLLVTYQLIQAGDWLVNYQVARIESKLAEDGRFRIEAYAWDPEALTITFQATLRDQPLEKFEPLEAGFGGKAIAVVVALIAGAAWGFLYDEGKIIRLFKGQTKAEQAADSVAAINANPDLTLEQKAQLATAAIQDVSKKSDIGLTAILIFGGLAVLAMFWLGVKR